MAVYGVPDPQWGERAQATVAPAPGRHIDTEAVGEWARSRLAGQKLPKKLRVMDETPHNFMFKIDRHALQNVAVAT